MNIPVLDHGFVRFVEAWGHGDAGDRSSETFGPDPDPDMECGIIEAARQSTQASFRGWEDRACPSCHGGQTEEDYSQFPEGLTVLCKECKGKGYLPGDARLLKYLFSHKPPHATPFEFAGMVIEVRAPIFVFREWHRHRTQSYNEMSARYAPLPDKNYLPDINRLFVGPDNFNKQAGTVPGAEHINSANAAAWLARQAELYALFEEHYQTGLLKGVPKEIARIGMPVGRFSQMRAQTNLRNWLAFITLRADPGAQFEIQEFARAVGKIVEKHFPRTWSLYLER